VKLSANKNSEFCDDAEPVSRLGYQQALLDKLANEVFELPYAALEKDFKQLWRDPKKTTNFQLTQDGAAAFSWAFNHLDLNLWGIAVSPRNLKCFGHLRGPWFMHYKHGNPSAIILFGARDAMMAKLIIGSDTHHTQQVKRWIGGLD